MLTTISAILLGLALGYFAHRIGSKYEIVRRDRGYTPDQLSIITARLNSIWQVLQANGYQTNVSTGFTGPVEDYSGYNFTGYAQAFTAYTGPSFPVGPQGAVGPQGERVALGGAVPTNDPPAELLPAPEPDHLEEPRYS